MRLLSVLLLFLLVASTFGLQVSSSKRKKTSSNRIPKIEFKYNDNDIDSNKPATERTGIWQSLKRFLPDVVKARFEKSYATPRPDFFNRYSIRISKPQDSKMRRHTITRLVRFFDLNFDSAATIVDLAISEEKALVRTINSLSEAKFLKKMLLSADPPVECEIFDEREKEIIL